jgi:PleD family two-component response regulator
MTFDDLSPEQLRLSLEAAYAALADDEATIARLWAELTGQTNENERLRAAYDRLQTIVHVDHLTGALNRRGIGGLLKAEVGYARRTETLLSLLFLDIDWFKRVNDEIGHLAGDAVLMELVRRLQWTLRRYDKVGRFGGKEIPITVSLGVAERQPTEIDFSLIGAADDALRQAKQGG